MLTKIQLLTTIECYEHINWIFSQVGMTDHGDSLVQNSYETLAPLAQTLRSTLLERHGSYDAFIANSANPITDLQLLLSPDAHQSFVEHFNQNPWNSSEERVIVPMTICTDKLECFDKFVGYAVPESEFDVDHMAEHEGITIENARKLMLAHNKWLRANKNKFDLFIDGKSKEEVVELIKSL